MKTSEPLLSWLLDPANHSLQAEHLVEQLSQRLIDAGIPIWRCSTSLLTLHPEVWTRNITWVRETGSRVLLVPHTQSAQPGYLDSPVRAVHQSRTSLRCRLLPGDEPAFPPLRELKEKGATDYVIHPLFLSDGRLTYLSFTTDVAGGFTDAQLKSFEALLPLLAMRLELESAHFATQCLLTTYLGSSAAERVLAGNFKRGGGERIRAAVWICDLRGFTQLVDQQPIEEVLAVLDRYFECTAGEVTAVGGEVLKFIGDAVLAIFPVGEAGPEDACRRALTAAEAALASMGKLNGERTGQGSSPLGLGVALHLGEVMYGNIGARNRLDFTVIGSAVNEVTRVESLCKPLGMPLLLSARFAEAAGVPVVSLGRHALKGVGEPMEVFTLRTLRS